MRSLLGQSRLFRLVEGHVEIMEVIDKRDLIRHYKVVSQRIGGIKNQIFWLDVTGIIDHIGDEYHIGNRISERHADNRRQDACFGGRRVAIGQIKRILTEEILAETYDFFLPIDADQFIRHFIDDLSLLSRIVPDSFIIKSIQNSDGIIQIDSRIDHKYFLEI